MDYHKIERYANDRVKPEVEKMSVAILEEMENKGGHAMMYHVGLSDEQLKDRMNDEENIYLASTFYTKEDAEKYIIAILSDEMNQLDIAEWLLNNSNFSSLTIYLPEGFHEITGKGYARSGKYVLLESAVVVLRKWIDNAGEVCWRMHTAYPAAY